MAQNFNVETKKKDDKKKAVALVYEPGKMRHRRLLRPEKV